MTALTVTRAEAAKGLSMSLRHFQRHVQPRLRVVRTGSLVLIPVSEIERWVAENQDR